MSIPNRALGARFRHPFSLSPFLCFFFFSYTACCTLRSILRNECTTSRSDGVWAYMCRLFVRRQCGRCRQPIVYNELVVQTNELVYHSDCFSCVLCNHHFTPGQQFAVAEDGNVYCPSDFQLRHSVPARDAAVSTPRDVPVTTAAHLPPSCPSPSGVDTVGSVWSDVPWQQLESSVRSSTYTFTPVAGKNNQSINQSKVAKLSLNIWKTQPGKTYHKKIDQIIV